tara:strand:+ start:2234 stop:2704 length:471 start_codon:yes stop_codon:yes gene_type:complete
MTQKITLTEKMYHKQIEKALKYEGIDTDDYDFKRREIFIWLIEHFVKNPETYKKWKSIDDEEYDDILHDKKDGILYNPYIKTNSGIDCEKWFKKVKNVFSIINKVRDSGYDDDYYLFDPRELICCYAVMVVSEIFQQTECIELIIKMIEDPYYNNK